MSFFSERESLFIFTGESKGWESQVKGSDNFLLTEELALMRGGGGVNLLGKQTAARGL